MPAPQATTSKIRLAEVIASLALATDLATGQPLEHGLRRTLLAVWLGQELGLDDEDLNAAYYVALLGTVGCVLDSAVFSQFVKDEIAMISAPEPGMPWGVTDAKGWYVCVMRGGRVSAIYIAGGRIMGSIDAPEHICGPGTVYEEFSRGY